MNICTCCQCILTIAIGSFLSTWYLFSTHVVVLTSQQPSISRTRGWLWFLWSNRLVLVHRAHLLVKLGPNTPKYICRVITMSLPRHCLVTTMSSPCYYHIFDRSLPCHHQETTMLPPCHFIVMVVSSFIYWSLISYHAFSLLWLDLNHDPLVPI